MAFHSDSEIDRATRVKCQRSGCGSKTTIKLLPHLVVDLHAFEQFVELPAERFRLPGREVENDLVFEMSPVRIVHLCFP